MVNNNDFYIGCVCKNCKIITQLHNVYCWPIKVYIVHMYSPSEYISCPLIECDEIAFTNMD